MRKKVVLHKKHGMRNLTIFLLVLILVGLGILAWAFFVEPGTMTTTYYTVSHPDIPENWDGRTIAFFSDVHSGKSYDAGRLAQAIDAMLAADPDLVLFGGDLVDSETPLHDAVFAQSITDQLARLKTPLGVYAVIGNHDNRLRAELDLAKTMLANAGITLLVNQAVNLDGLWLGGLDESYFGRPDLAATLAQGQTEGSSQVPEPGSSTVDGLFRILLMHQPDYLGDDRTSPIDLILSGHSHNGQITLFGYPLITVYQGRRYPYGQYDLGSNTRQMIVSRGLGTVGIHARLFAPPEVVILTLDRLEN